MAKYSFQTKKEVVVLYLNNNKCYNEIAASDIVTFLLSQDDELKNSYNIYQEILTSIKNKDSSKLKLAVVSAV